MHQSSKPQNYGKESKLSNFEEEDQISSLPDEILCHILSFMRTKYAVRTSLLSTRWRFLWTSVPNFDFYNYSRRDNKDENSSFMDFVDRVLLLHNSASVNRFHLRCYYGYYAPYRVNLWICNAIKFNVQELVLNLCIEHKVELSPSLFTSVNLVVLKLAGDVLFRVPMRVSLPSLKVLHLNSLTCLDDDSFENLLSGCPVLEELDVQRCQGDNIKTLCIRSSTLKILVIYSSNPIGSSKCGVVIKAPALEILDLLEYESAVFHVDELPSLVKANFRVLFRDVYYERTEDYYRGVVRMLGKTSTLQHLRLSTGTLKAFIRAASCNLMLFHSLTHLHIGVYALQWSVLLDLLGSIPRLKVLVVEKDTTSCRGCSWRATPENVPKCLSLSLETIEFSGFAGCKEEMKLIQYLLENAMVLRKLTLHSCSGNKNIKRNLQKHKKGSSTCQIELHIPYSYKYPSVQWL